MNNREIGLLLLNACRPRFFEEPPYGIVPQSKVLVINDELNIIIYPRKKMYKLEKNKARVYLRHLDENEKDDLVFTIDEFLLLSI
jgi:hypothetical protein